MDEMRVGGRPITETFTECTKAALLLQRNVDFCLSVSSSQHCCGQKNVARLGLVARLLVVFETVFICVSEDTYLCWRPE